MSRKREAIRKILRNACNEYGNTYIELKKEIWPNVKTPQGLTRIFRNNQFVVEIFDDGIDPFTKEKSIKVMVRHNTGKPIVQWSHLQDIKNQIFGKESLAVQYLPPESKLVDQANMYWFFVRE